MVQIAASNTEKPGGHVLIVDDDVELCELLRDYLSRQGLRVDTVNSAEDALDWLQVRDTPPDVMVLDLMLPGMDGLSALRRIRTLSALPVLMLSGRGEPMDRVAGLELGADDYLAKPAMPRELLARIHALLRRAPASGGELKLGNLKLAGSQRRAWLSDAELELTAAEFAVLHELLKHAGQIVSREDLTQRALHRALEKFDRSVDVHVSRLRQKLAGGPVIESVRGAGYVIAAGKG